MTTTNDNLQILEVRTRKDFRRFVRFQNRLYRGNKFYVPALEVDELKLFSPKNPSWNEVELKAFLAIRAAKPPRHASHATPPRRGIIVGRIAVIIQKTYNKLHNCKNARITRFDFVDDAEVAKALLDAACDFARAQGMEVIHGPLGFNDLDGEGVLVEGFDRLGTFANFYNYAYYKNYLEDYGFEKDVDFLEFLIKMPKELDARMVKVAERMKERLELQVLPLSMSKSRVIKQYGKEIFDVINECYADLHGVIPITDAVRAGILKQFKTIIRREHVVVVLDKTGKIVGFSLGAPNISRSLNASNGRLLNFGFLPINALRIKLEARRLKYIDMCLIAVVPEYRGKGVNAIIINEVFKNLVGKTEFLETNLQMETNTAVQSQFDGFDKELIKKRRCYTKVL